MTEILARAGTQDSIPPQDGFLKVVIANNPSNYWWIFGYKAIYQSVFGCKGIGNKIIPATGPSLG